MMSRRDWCRRVACVAAVLVVMPVLSAHAAAEQLQRASDAALQWLDSSRSPVDGKATALRLDTPDGQVLELLLEAQMALMRDALAHVPGVKDGSTRVYAGEVAGRPGSWVRLTRIGPAWLGAVHDGEALWFLDPASHHQALAQRMGLDGDATLVYTLADLVEPLDFHGDTVVAPMEGHMAANGPVPAAVLGSPDYELRVTLVMDTEFQQLHAASASVAVAVLNVVDGFFVADLGTRIRLHHLVALADNGPLTMLEYESLFAEFKAFVPANDIPFHGVAHLLSGRQFVGGPIGYASLNSLCKLNGSYGINQMNRPAGGNATLLGHEIAHNFGVEHDDVINVFLGLAPTYIEQNCKNTYIMWPIISSQNPATGFSPCTEVWFNHRLPQHQACLAPVGLPFGNGFDLDVLTIP